MKTVEKTDAEWRDRLTPEQYAVLRQAATERPFTGKYVDTEDDGMYHCAAVATALYERHQVPLRQRLAELHRRRLAGRGRIADRQVARDDPDEVRRARGCRTWATSSTTARGTGAASATA